VDPAAHEVCKAAHSIFPIRQRKVPVVEIVAKSPLSSNSRFLVSIVPAIERRPDQALLQRSRSALAQWVRM
jgi:hypothetical protein